MQKDQIKKRGIIILIILVFLIFCSSILIFFTKFSIQSLFSKTPIQQTVSALPHNEHQIITTYNQAMLQHDWVTIYQTTTQSIIGSDTQEEFAQKMEQQIQSIGSISSITVTSESEVKTNSDGMIYFTVLETVVLNQHHTTQKLSIVSVFILENGVWKYFSSKSI